MLLLIYRSLYIGTSFTQQNLIYWGLNKMADILQMTFSKAFLWMENIFIQISLMFILKVSVHNEPVMPCHNVFVYINSSSPGQNGRHFANDIFKCIFVNEKCCILIQIWLKFVPEGPIDNKSTLVQVMECRLFGAKPLSEPMLIQFTDVYIMHLGELS